MKMENWNFAGMFPPADQLVLRESNQEIRVKTQLSETGDWNDLVIELKKVNVGDFAPLFLPKNRLEGLVSGNLLVEDPTNNLHITSDNILAEGLRLDNDSLGNVKASVVYNGKVKELKVKGNTLNPENNLAIDGTVYFDKARQKDNLIALKANKFELKFLNGSWRFVFRY